MPYEVECLWRPARFSPGFSAVSRVIDTLPTALSTGRLCEETLLAHKRLSRREEPG